MSDADPHAVRGSQGGKKPTSFTLVSMPVPILAAQNVRGNSTSTVRFQKDEERTEYDRLSLYLPFDHTWSPPPLTEPDFICNIFYFGQLLVYKYHSMVFHCRSANLSSLLRPDGKLQPICERDLYRRRDLTCAKCKQALKGGYIPAFRTYLTYCVHPPSHHARQFWDIRLAKNVPQGPFPPETYTPEEAQHGLSATSEGQISAEALARLIWTRLSEYEESSLACLSDIARHVGNGLDLEAIQAAGRLVLHIEVLFAAIDELERAGAESLPQPSYAENLLYTASDLIETLSGAQDDPPESYPIPLEIQRERTVQALLALTPSLVSHHKNLVIIVLKEALKLKQGTSSGNAPLKFLNRLKRLAMDGADPNADRREYFTPANITNADASPSITTNPLSTRALEHFPSVTVDYSEGVAYGYQSLSPRCTGESPTSPNFILRAVKDGIIMLPFLPSDECIECLSPINEGCVRLGTYQRWHLRCFACATCGKSAEDKIDSWEGSLHENSSRIDASPEAREVPPPTNLTDFRYGFLTAPGSPFDTPKIYCTTHTGEELWHGGRFEEVTRLEQYAFLLYVAIRRSYYMLLGYSYVHTTTGK
ncbi:hypothetical protein FS837_010073 [Tulasnella sp. UAMH 9824]|nr:hypothetical protein FS837_010073 [Tulasnella sp. UAMH 9824]